MGNQQARLNHLLPIPSLDGYYINELGEVFSTKRTKDPKKLKPHKHLVSNSNKYYWRIKVAGRLWLVHRLVAMVKYNKELLKEETINHINGDTLNNTFNNLEIATHAEQVAHAVQTGLYCSGDEWYIARGLSPKEK